MSAVIPGDIVRHGEVSRVVVDVTDDGLAVLRDELDVELEQPIVTSAADLEVVGHLEGLDGWVELEPGVWEQT